VVVASRLNLVHSGRLSTRSERAFTGPFHANARCRVQNARMDSPRRLLPRCRPEDVDVDPGGVFGFLDAQKAAELETHAMLLVRHGRVFAEGYWHPYTPGEHPLVYSLR